MRVGAEAIVHLDGGDALGGCDHLVALAFEVAQIRKRGPLRPPRKLNMTVSPNEADISVGARSFRAVVLSLDEKRKGRKGPINDALAAGGKVIFLNDFNTSGKSLRDFILERL